MKINADFKIFHLLEEYPESEEVIRKYFKFFYDERLVDIALKRLSIQGAFNVLNTPPEQQREFFKELKEKVGLDVSRNLVE